MSKPTPAQREKRHTVRVKQHRLRVKAKKQDAANQALTAPLTAQGLKKETRSAVNIRYGGQERELQSQARAQDRTAANAAGWFQDYRAAVDAATQRSQQNALATSQAIQGLSERSSVVDASNRNATLEQQQSSAASRGATVDPSLAGIATQAEASRRASMDNQAAASLRTGQSQTDYLGDQSRIGAGRQVQAQQSIQARKESIKQQIAALKAEEGDYANQYRANARVTERNNQATNAALGIKQQQSQLDILKTKIDQQNKAAGRRETRRHNKASEQNTASGNTNSAATLSEKTRHDRATEAAAAAKAAKGGGGKKNYTPVSRTAAQNNLSKARNLLHASPSTLQGRTQAQIIALLTGKSVPADIAKAAYQYHYFGGVKPHLRHHLARKYGIHTKKAGHKHKVQSRSDAGLGSVGGALTGVANSIPKKK